ncbi:MAG: dephospho-CoA kinase [Proteobacteria bacterium]|nr:dephospho-CoA kinase [Pseudomonadota bacterium]MBU1712911.1 dephospho-CoA kinase [Pseudomonadota bacterium]
MIIAGLTGGIATGKSTVSSILREAGAIVIDADAIARDAVGKNLPAWHEIVSIFGNEVLLPDGEIDRSRLGGIIFRDSSKKEILNKIVHPRVIQKVAEMIEEIGEAYPGSIVILDVPLLIEAEMHKGLEDVILVYTPEQIQIRRLVERDGISDEEALLRVRSQMPIEEKREFATIIIDNSGTLQATRERAFEVFNYLKIKAD